ncbi:MAG TPA: hypothetical protein VIR56_11915 [Solimonas sp.]
MGLDAIQWFAMATTVGAAWLVAAQNKRRRKAGFWVYLVSSVLWVAWGLHDHAWALIALQFCLAALNIRGVNKNEPGDRAEPAPRPADSAS